MRQGVSSELTIHAYALHLDKQLKMTVQRGYGRLEWWCLNWNQPSIDFYKSLGAQTMDEWTDYRLSGKELEDLAK